MEIGYTTGVFDLFHVGHLNVLRRAASECDLLIVGVTDCETVKKYKGYYPIIPLEERLEIISELKCVDKVVVQTSMDKYLAWKELKYNKLFHGDDWQGSDMYNQMELKLKNLGVQVIYFPYTKGTSTSLLKERVYEQYNKG